ncbi:MAG: NADH-quinone oxidoreductase subunit NuoE [Bacteroidetes bacterium]|nr:NADH-quinone oxidoreductase subunit NuoE [Bacteroidota bacterium]
MDNEIDSIFQKHQRNQREALIPILQDIQEQYGYISEEAVQKVGLFLAIPTSKIYGVATFYDQFHFQPKGKFHITVCRGTTCHLEESDNLLEEVSKYLKISQSEVSRDGMFSLETTTCMGACGRAPVISVNGNYYEQMTIDTFKELIESFKQRAL